ncbi:MAG: histidine kinase [Lachnospiraceae bacterium]|nr:histidine kinase [Lachnospiraceae bacterium]
MNKLRLMTKKFNFFIIAVAVVFFLIIGVISGMVLDKQINENMFRRTVSELNAMAKKQKRLVEHEIERQFISLEYLSANLRNNDVFVSEKTRSMINTLVEINKWCTVGYADLEGNTISYKGENLGNIGQRAYFKEIVDGSQIRKADYLSSTNMVEEPRFLFSVPVYKDGVVTAVLFASKEVSVMEPILLSNDNAADNANVFLVSGDGTILCANSTRYNYAVGDDYYSFLEKNGFAEDYFKDELLTSIREKKSGVFTYNHGIAEIISCCPIEINDWVIIVTADQKALEVQYGVNLKTIRKQVAIIMIAYGALLFFVLISGSFFLRKLSKSEYEYRIEKIRNDIMMNEMGCELFTYDIRTKAITTEGVLHEKYGFDFEIPINQLIEKQRPLHPECNFDRIMNAFKRAINTRENQEVEFMLLFERELRWIKLTLIPYSISGRKMTHVLGSFLNVSEEHTEFEKDAELLANMPGGFHRCYLSDPIHVEYISNGLCELLGYTKDELDSIMVDGNYALAIYEEDRGRFDQFAYRLANKPGVDICEYRMMRKDGSLVSVSDTMESILANNGIMYGYSVVYDISSLTSEIETLTDELENAKVKNSLSQMQPHFLYNALASIREIILVDPEYASELIVDFTTHLRACIKTMSSNNLIPFRQELDNIKAYVNIEKMRLGEKLKVEYNVACDDFMIVPLSIQPIVENAVRHGIYERGAKGGTVSISVYRNNEEYVVCVKDDGIGFDYEKMKEEVESGKRDSTGISSLVFRLEKMLKAKLEIMSAIGCGTEVTVRIPVVKNILEGDEEK